MRSHSSAAILSVRDITRSFSDGGVVTEVLRGVDLDINQGEFVGLVGPSGCGKSTLLSIIGLADRASSGELIIDGESVSEAQEKRLRDLRRTKLGYVFQQFNILSTLSARENVMVPLMLNGIGVTEAQSRAEQLLVRVGLADRLDTMPFKLSGGELQRVAIARAVVHRPRLVLADEPTGNLDSVSGERVLDLLRELVSEGVTVLMATHSESAMARCDRVIRLRDGEIV